MTLTKAELKRLGSLSRRARKLEADAHKLAQDARKELVRQMRKS